MALHIDLKHLTKSAKTYRGALGLNSLAMDTRDALMHPASGIAYDFRAERRGHNLLLRGEIKQTFEFACARCLVLFQKEICLNWKRLIPIFGEDALPVKKDCLDLTPIVREDMLLALPQHPLCASNCNNSPMQKHESSH